VTIEKVFAIDAEPEQIWDELWSELQTAGPGHFVIEESHWPSRLVLKLDLAGLPSRISYQIERKDGHCEVAGVIEPLSFRYRMYQVLSFGHMRVNYEMLLAEGLSNLKAAVESPEEETAGGFEE
jgi:hypothetical protein